MDSSTKNYVRLKAFRAIDRPDLCDKFIEGHSRVLSSVGVEKVTSNTNEWTQNPASFVVLCESQDGEKTYGGARVHAYGGSQVLPIEEATLEMDPTIVDHVKRFAPQGTGELCGLWNSIEVAGMGIGAVYLIRCAIAILTQLGLGTCWALCSPFSARIAKNSGFLKYPDVGNDGTFYYPKIDLLATACLVEDSSKLEFGNPDEVQRIQELRKNPIQKLDETNRGRTMNVEYNLLIENVDKSLFKWS